MKILTRKEIVKHNLVSEIKKGKIFIYPTDTIYGIGCDALNSSAVIKIRKIKKRDSKPFSVVAPSKMWIVENCFNSDLVKKWVKELPGPYTLILKLKNKNAVAKEVNLGTESLGIRIPNNWFSEFVSEAGVPFVTTSVNLAGEKPITKLSNLKEEIEKHIDYFIDDGILEGTPSTLVNLLGDKGEIINR